MSNAGQSRQFAVSIRARLVLIQLSLLLALLAVSLVGWHASESERRAGHQLALVSRAERNHDEAELLHQSLLADVEEALRVDTQTAETDVLADAKSQVRELEAHLAALRDPELPRDTVDQLQSLIARSSRQGVAAVDLIETAFRDRALALRSEPAFLAEFHSLASQSEAMAALLKRQVQDSERYSFGDASRSEIWIIATCAVTAVLAWAFVALISSSVRQSLRRVCDAARALAAGNLSARSKIETHDEVGELAISLNKMADELQGMVDRLLADAHRDAFGARVGRAMEMAESERDVRDIAARALEQIGELPAELLLAAPGTDALRQTAVHPLSGAPGCGVDTPGGCAAIRRGTSITFESGEALDACPRLRGRPGGPISATCVPVAFMGRTFGVLHAASGDKRPPTSQQQSQLTALGLHTGARIGTLRTLESTRQHAYSDALTGLGNRRAMEQASHRILQSGTRYALGIADLDHFKRLNDAHGHDAGDRALQTFAEVLTTSIRQADKAARWGGEEFAILFPDASALQVFEVVDRVRTRLAETLAASGQPAFTVSVGLADSTMGESFDAVFRIADQALYLSKDRGRNRTTVAPHPETEISQAAAQSVLLQSTGSDR